MKKSILKSSIALAVAGVFGAVSYTHLYFITMAMVAIGLNTNIVKLLKSGGSALALGACCWIAISAVSLMAQHMIGLW